MSIATVRLFEERTLSPAPERSIEQRMDALARANLIRTRRSELKRDLRARRVSICDVIAEPPEYVLTMKVFHLLLATPRLGRVAVNKALAKCGVAPSKTVGGLSDRQRQALIVRLVGR